MRSHSSTSTSDNKHSLKYVSRSFIAGGVAGCVAKTVIAPLDRVKILFQTRNPEFVKFSGSALGLFRCLKTIHHESGLRGLFQGHSATVLRIFPYASIKFMVYEQYKAFLMPTPEDITWLRRTLAGSLSGVTCVFCTYPLELIRVRMAYSHKKPRISDIVKIIRDEKPFTTTNIHFLRPLLCLTNFYRGFLPTIYGMVPYAGASFLVYETIAASGLQNYPKLTHYHYKNRKSRSKPLFSLFNGAIAGVIGQTVSYPLEIIRRRMQVSGLFPDRKEIFQSTWRTGLYIYSREGVRGFFTGITIGYVKVIPMVATSFTVYEIAKHWLNI